jgi:hypothetical protein
LQAPTELPIPTNHGDSHADPNATSHDNDLASFRFGSIRTLQQRDKPLQKVSRFLAGNKPAARITLVRLRDQGSATSSTGKFFMSDGSAT